MNRIFHLEYKEGLVLLDVLISISAVGSLSDLKLLMRYLDILVCYDVPWGLKTDTLAINSLFKREYTEIRIGKITYNMVWDN
jgi:hypothetical protein